MDRNLREGRSAPDVPGVRYRFSGVCVSVRVFFGALNMSEGCLFVLYRRGRAKLTP